VADPEAADDVGKFFLSTQAVGAGTDGQPVFGSQQRILPGVGFPATVAVELLPATLIVTRMGVVVARKQLPVAQPYGRSG
jgi:hypothetical protein